MTVAALALICGAALIGPLLALWSEWRVPLVVVELAVGVILGTSLLAWIDATDATFAFLASDIGFALVMFVAGSHVPLRSPGLRAGLQAGLGRAIAIGVLSIPVGLALATLFGTGHGLLYAVLFASSSAAIIMPMLGGVDQSTPPMLAMLTQVAIADIACIILLPLVIDPALAVSRLLGIALVAGASLGAFFLLRWLQRNGTRKRAHQISEERGLALELRISLTLLFGVVALGQMHNVSPMLAGFGLGLAVAAVGEPRRLAKQLFALSEGFFGPLFFVWLGAGINIAAVVAEPKMIVLGLVLGLAAVMVHGVMWPTRQPLALAVATSAQMGVPAAAVALGTTQGTLLPGEGAAILLGALVTIGIGSVAAIRLAR